MLALIRVVVLEWILARLALRWVLGIGVLAAGGLIFFIGVPMLLTIAGVWLAWRWFKGAEARAQSPATRPSSPV
jgi:hypothetical protein